MSVRCQYFPRVTGFFGCGSHDFLFRRPNAAIRASASASGRRAVVNAVRRHTRVTGLLGVRAKRRSGKCHPYSVPPVPSIFLPCRGTGNGESFVRSLAGNLRAAPSRGYRRATANKPTLSAIVVNARGTSQTLLFLVGNVDYGTAPYFPRSRCDLKHDSRMKRVEKVDRVDKSGLDRARYCMSM